MIAHSRKHLTAWLGLFAMWLIVLAPLVSQLAVAARHDVLATQNVLCSATPSEAKTTAPRLHADGLAACAYCDLLASHVPMPALPAAPLAAVVLLTSHAIAAPASLYVPATAFPSGRPRAPPASHA